MNPVKSWRQELSLWPPLAPDFKIEPQKTALVIIDMQYLDAHADYGLGKIMKEQYPEAANYYLPRLTGVVVPNIQRLLGLFREKRLRVIHLTVGPELPDGKDFNPFRRTADGEIEGSTGKKSLYHKGTFEHSILEELKPHPGEYVLNKVSRGAFNSTGLDLRLRNMGTEGLVITGVVTNACVMVTALDAADRGFKTILVDDACGGLDQSSHDGVMKTFAGLFGKVWDVQEVLDYFSR